MKASKSLVLVPIIISLMALTPMTALSAGNNLAQSSLVVKQQTKEIKENSKLSKPVLKTKPVQKEKITKSSTPSVPVVKKKPVQVEKITQYSTPSQPAEKRNSVQVKKITGFCNNKTRTIPNITESKCENLGGEFFSRLSTAHTDLIRKRQGLIQSKIRKQVETAAPLQKNVAVGKLDINRKNLPHADDTSKIFEEFGGDTYELGSAGWHSTKDELEGLANGLTDGKPGNPIGSGSDDLQDNLIDAENALGKGSSELITGLNSNYDEYWGDVVAGIRGSGGIIASEYTYKVIGYDDGNMLWKEWYDDGSVWLWEYYDGEQTGWELRPPKGSGGGTEASDGRDEEGNERNFITDRARGLRPIEVNDPNKKESGIKIVQTDTGKFVVVDYGQLRDATKTGPEEGMRIGMNHLTGEAVNVIPEEVDPKSRFGQSLKQEILNPITNPTR